MKNNTFLTILTLAGAVSGYGVEKIGNASDFELFSGTIFGAFLTWQLGRAIISKYYLVFIGPIVGLLISIGSDLLAGSEVVVVQKLMYMVMGLLAGWPFRKSLLAGGAIGSVIGFIWGLNAGHWFGEAYLQPGILNASLLAIQVALVGMFFTRMIVEFVEAKMKADRNRIP